MRGTKIESLSEFGSFYRKIELSEFVRNWHILGVRILSINELFCHVGNCWNLSKDVNGIDTQYQLEKCNRKNPVGNLHEERKKTWTLHTPMTPTLPLLGLPMRTSRPHDTLGSVALLRTYVGDSWEWHGKVRVAHALKKVSIGI